MAAAREQQRELEATTDTTDQEKTEQQNVDFDIETEPEDTLEPDMYYENIEIDEEDEKAIEMFMSDNPKPNRTLADIIMEKITEKQTELDTHFSDSGSVQMQELDPRVKQMYEGVGNVLKHYRSGKLPKAFKVIPHLRNWEQILYCTGKN